MLLLVPAVVCAVLFAILRRRDRRMLRNGVLLTAAVVFGVLGVVDVASHRFPLVAVLVFGLLLLMPVAVLVLAAFLVANGIRMFRREGRSLGNLLSLVVGLALVALAVVSVTLLRVDTTIAGTVLSLIIGIAAYVGAVFCVFLVSALVYGRGRLPPQAEVVIVLGSGLVDGQVPPLLRSRLDQAIAVYHRSVEAGVTPLMIPSGGQGADEPRLEGAAMAEYLFGQGIPVAHVVAETQSRNTRENLLLSGRVQDAAGVGGRVVVVTNEYHVMRAAMLARSLGSPAKVLGAKTARYYVPSAFLREFLAVVALHRRAHAIVLVLGVAAWMLLLIDVVRSG